MRVSDACVIATSLSTSGDWAWSREAKQKEDKIRFEAQQEAQRIEKKKSEQRRIDQEAAAAKLSKENEAKENASKKTVHKSDAGSGSK